MKKIIFLSASLLISCFTTPALSLEKKALESPDLLGHFAMSYQQSPTFLSLLPKEIRVLLQNYLFNTSTPEQFGKNLHILLSSEALRPFIPEIMDYAIAQFGRKKAFLNSGLLSIPAVKKYDEAKANLENWNMEWNIQLVHKGSPYVRFTGGLNKEEKDNLVDLFLPQPPSFQPYFHPSFGNILNTVEVNNIELLRRIWPSVVISPEQATQLLKPALRHLTDVAPEMLSLLLSKGADLLAHQEYSKSALTMVTGFIHWTDRSSENNGMQLVEMMIEYLIKNHSYNEVKPALVDLKNNLEQIIQIFNEGSPKDAPQIAESTSRVLSLINSYLQHPTYTLQ